MPNSVLVVFLVLLLGPTLIAQRGATDADRVAVLDTLDALFSIPNFINRLGIEHSGGLATESTIRSRLEERVDRVFAADERDLRLRMVRDGSIHHTWSDWFADLHGARFSGGVVTFPGDDRAVYSVKLSVLDWVQLIEPMDVDALFQRYPVKNITRDEVLRRQRAAPAGEILVFVASLKGFEVSLLRTARGWRVSDVSIKPDTSHLEIDSR